jgi:hypothetical protein
MDQVKFDDLTPMEMAQKLYNDNYDTNSHPHSVKERQKIAIAIGINIAMNNMNKYADSTYYNVPRYVYWWEVKNRLFRMEKNLK